MTDSLKSSTESPHKFLAVGGILLATCSIIFPGLFFERASTGYLDERLARDQLQVYEKLTPERLATLDIRKQQAFNDKNNLEAQLDKLNPGPNVPANSSAVDKLETQLGEVKREIKSIEDESHQLSLDLELRRVNAKHEEDFSFNRRRNSRVFMVAGGIMAVIGLLISFMGCWQWRKRLRRQPELIAKEAEPKLEGATESTNQIEQKPPAQLPEVAVSTPSQPIPVDVVQKDELSTVQTR